MPDYYLILITGIPGILYTLLTLAIRKKANFTGIFLLATMLIDSALDLLAGSVCNMFVYGFWQSTAMTLFYGVTLLVRRPLSMYFALDVAELQGYNRQACRKLYHQPKPWRLLKLVTALMGLKSLGFAVIKWTVLTRFYSESLGKLLIGYDNYLFYVRIYNWVWGAVIAICWLLFYKTVISSDEEDLHPTAA
ncbi:MAG: hypothetical protein K0Q90_555 [Paenibacillaceae bacterium]|nr:hypothetical protein [Paenibacillaceae bacterium]